DMLQVHVSFEIDVDGLSTSNALFDRALRAARASGDYPLAFYVAGSERLVPVTEARVALRLTGDLERHRGVRRPPLDESAPGACSALEALASSTPALARHGVELPALRGGPAIDLRAVIVAHEATR